MEEVANSPKQSQQLSLSGILDTEVTEEMYAEAEAQRAAEGWDEEEGVSAKEGFCIECEGLNELFSVSSLVLILLLQISPHKLIVKTVQIITVKCALRLSIGKAPGKITSRSLSR